MEALIFMGGLLICLAVGRHFDGKHGSGNKCTKEALGFFFLASLGILLVVFLFSFPEGRG